MSLERAKLIRVRRMLLRVMPESWSCRNCGPLVAVDEDGCCSMCGHDCRRIKTANALKRLGL